MAGRWAQPAGNTTSSAAPARRALAPPGPHPLRRPSLRRCCAHTMPTAPQHRGPGDRAHPPPGRARRLPVVLRALRSAPVRGVLPAHRYRKAASAGIRTLLHEHRQAYMHALRQGHGALVNARIAVGGRELDIDVSRPVMLALALDFAGPQPRHFGAPPASSKPFEAAGFKG